MDDGPPAVRLQPGTPRRCSGQPGSLARSMPTARIPPLAPRQIHACRTAQFISDLSRYDSVVYAITGKHPAVWGSDFSFNALGENIAEYHHCGPMNLSSPWGECLLNGRSTEELRQNLVEEIKQRYAEGRIITLMWHCCFPSECNDCNGASIWTWQNRPSDEVWAELTTDGTPLNTLWKKTDGHGHPLPQAVTRRRHSDPLASVPRDERRLVLVVQQTGRERIQETVDHDLRLLHQGARSQQSAVGLETPTLRATSRATRPGHMPTTIRAPTTSISLRPMSTTGITSSRTTTTCGRWRATS